jgi:hypothetical protein
MNRWPTEPVQPSTPHFLGGNLDVGAIVEINMQARCGFGCGCGSCGEKVGLSFKEVRVEVDVDTN